LKRRNSKNKHNKVKAGQINNNKNQEKI
jgi:hypothetical protein